MIFKAYNIDESRLQRNYLEQPIIITSNGVGSERLNENELQYLYIDLNMMVKEIADFVGVKISNIERWLRKYKIKKDLKLVVENNKKSCMKKYGVKNAGWTNESQKKIKETNINNYGTMFPGGLPKFVEKAQNTKIRKYGDPFYYNKDKQKQTNLEKYGVEYPLQLSEIQLKCQQEKMRKYGDPFYYNKDKQKQTCLNKYGRNHQSQEHYSDKTYTILLSFESLKEYILNQDIKTYINISNKLGITPTTLRNYIVKYNLQELIDIDINESSYEQELQELYPFLKRHNRKILNGKEIDLYDEKHNIGIEFNGNYWHNEYGKEKNYHQEKSLLAEEKGIFIYHIFEYEWNTKKERIINQLNNLLKVNSQKIGARNCIIKEVSNKEKTQFLEENHLQGNDSSSIKLGLYYNNDLVSLMTFCKPRFNKNYEWELSRFCCKANCNVIGGASKLFKYFMNIYKPKSIISYSNIAHTKGNLYKMLGFELDSISEPNYVWCNGHETLSRYQCQKHKLLEQGYKGNSETEIMHNRGYYRIYDCGNKVWVLKGF